MVKNKHKSKLQSVIYQLRIERVYGLGVTVALILICAHLYGIENNEKTVIVPLNFNTSFTVEGDRVSPEGVKQVAMPIIQARLTYSPRTVLGQWMEILNYVHPSSYSVMKSRFVSEAERIERNEEGSVFYVSSMTVDHNDVMVTGRLIGMLGSRVVSDKKASFQLSFEWDSSDVYRLKHFKRVYLNQKGEVTGSYDEESANLTDSAQNSSGEDLVQ